MLIITTGRAIAENSVKQSDYLNDPADAVQSSAITDKKKHDELFTFAGLIESENYWAYSDEYSNSRKFDGPTFGKSEIHGKLSIKFGTDRFNFKSTAHGYLYYPDEDITDPWYENRIVLTEGYVTYKNPDYVIQAGQQLIKWGTANTVNPTSYFNPPDLTEILLKDDDERFKGVPAFLWSHYIGDFSIQAVVTPIHTPADLPEYKSPWSFIYPDLSGVSTVFDDSTKDLKSSYHNIGYGIRFSGTIEGIDFSLSGYHGPDKDIILKPVFDFSAGKILMVPVYTIINAVGADLAFGIGDITLQAEAAYTHDKAAIVNPETAGDFPVSIATQGYLSWASGGTWITDNNFTVVLEYVDSFYMSRNDRYMPALFSELLSASIKKQIMDELFTFEIKGLYNIEKKDSMVISSIELSLYNNTKIKISSALFSGEESTLFGSYSTRDIISVRIRYIF